MQQPKFRKRSHARLLFSALIVLRLAILVGVYFSVRTNLQWFWATFSFVPALIICLFASERKYVLASLLLLFISQQAVFVFLNPSWGFTYGSDSINDFQTASLMSETTHFDLGKLGYSSRLSYSYYPMLHLFSVVLSDASGLALTEVALYFIPILTTLMTTLVLYYLNHELFGLEGRERNIATLLFEMSFYYTAFHSEFVREAFAFPLVLFSIWIATRIATKPSSNKGRAYIVLALISFTAVVLAHHVSSYLLLAVLAIMALSFRIFYKNSRLIGPFLLMATVLGAYTAFVTLGFTVTQGLQEYEGFQAIFQRDTSPSVLQPYNPLTRDLAYIQYAIIGVLVLIGGVVLLRRRRRNWVVLTLVSFFTLAFILCVFLRLSTPADPWSFTYYMSLRGTIWAFLGISVITTIGLVCLFKLKKVSRKSFAVLLIVICVLGVGKFSQYGAIVTDSSNIPLTHQRYVAAIWLKGDTVHGSRMLVAPGRGYADAFEGARSMAPYAYLKEYFLDNKTGVVYEGFSGYIPFIGEFYEQYRNSSHVITIYSNGNTDIGYKYP